MKHLWLLIVPSLAACGAGPTPAPDWRVAYPTAHYIVAQAQDTTPEAAAAAARAGVAAQIASRLKASTEVDSSETGGESKQSVRHRVATETGFAHAELIETPPKLQRCEEICTAVAVLNRERALDKLRPAYISARARFARAAKAASGSDLRQYTLHLTAARLAHQEVEDLAAPMAVIGGEAPEGRQADRETRRALDARAEALLNATPIHLDMATVEADLRPALTRALVRGFGELGLRATPSACDAGLSFTPKAAVRCDRSALGPRCQLGLTGALTRCGGAPLTALDFSAARLAAVHPRSSDHARARLITRVAKANLTEVLRANLAAVLPVSR